MHNRKQHCIFLALCMLLYLLPLNAIGQTRNRTVEQRLKQYFLNYKADSVDVGKCKLVRYQLNPQKRTLTIHANANFAYQPFRSTTTAKIYQDIRNILPGPINYYHITVLVGEKSIDDLIPNNHRKVKDVTRLWGETEHQGNPWVQNLSRPYTITQGLQGRHLSVTPSHGMFYKNEERRWKWQRPSLFCTREDLLSQSIVVPYLIPMLENAGAVVFTARERDHRAQNLIVDNDFTSPENGLYREKKHQQTLWESTPIGFATPEGLLDSTMNPFTMGTARIMHTTQEESLSSSIQWIPNIPEDGTYAVYVSYQSTPSSISDAHYQVHHKGGVTHIRVNQQMGSGTWVYIGSYEFAKGQSDKQMVMLSNKSQEKGDVCADAVRFGGGSSLVNRGNGDTISIARIPRYYEGARYQAQWSGFPYERYANYQGENDYAEDINSRSLTTNYLLGGSVYSPDSIGLRVPIELSLSLHTDAGVRDNDAIIGTLGIYTTDYNHGRIAGGTLSRHTSRDLTDITMTNLMRDIRYHNNTDSIYTRRGMWDKNYSESRLPEVPSCIIELLSHQNFSDMRYAHDPHFKFIVARAIYKSILQYTSLMHSTSYTMQPLPINTFAIDLVGDNKVRLSWQPTPDPLEPSAVPTQYILYTRIDHGGFDNGQILRTNGCEITLTKGHTYNFKVTAVNKGGESFPSEILATYIAEEPKGNILIVNGFQRISGPAAFQNEKQAGFDLLRDPGVPYIGSTAYSGIQHVFDRDKARHPEEELQFGASGDELNGAYMAGNTFDFASVHGTSIKAAGYSFVSCSRKAFERGVVMPDSFDVVDLYLGLQRYSDSDVVQHPDYSTVTPALLRQLTRHTQRGGHLLVSGSYLGIESTYNSSARDLLHDVLHGRYDDSVTQYEETHIHGLENLTIQIPRWVGPERYGVPAPEVLKPDTESFTPFVYDLSHRSAAVAYKGKNYRSVCLGFPFESIHSVRDRHIVMMSLLKFLTE